MGALIGDALRAEGVPHRVQFAGNMVSVFFAEDEVADYAAAQAAATWRFPAFFHALLDRGVYAPPSAFEAWFVSAALDDGTWDVIEAALPSAARAAATATPPVGGRAVTGPRTVVHLLRHGEVHNPDGILYGRLPGFRLSANGRDQAEIVAKSLADADLAAVVASPMQRAQETAAPIAAMHGLEVTTDERLIEAGSRFEGERVSVGDGVVRHPRYWPLLRDPFTPSWGEPYLPIAHRMLGAVHRARLLAEGHEAVCVSHQLPIWTLRRFLNGQRLWHDPRHRQCALASLTSLVFTGTELTQLQYSEPAGAANRTQTGA